MKCYLVVPGCLLCLAIFACSADPGAVSDSNEGTDTTEQDALKQDTAGTDTESCQYWHYPMDFTYGEDCWAPPENLCRNGPNTMISWFCNSDGSKCCITRSSDCFHCGWIRCQPDEAGKDVSSACEALNIPQKYIDCGNMTENCLPDIEEEMRNSGDCAFTFPTEETPEFAEYTYCWDDHVE